LRDGKVSTFEVTPHDFGLSEVPIDALRGGNATRNAEIIRGVLAGEQGPARVAVLLNAAAALCVAGVASDPRAAVERATEAVDSGAATETLDRWARFTRDS
jgi:anthranilate phosphoribosyltransferase